MEESRRGVANRSGRNVVSAIEFDSLGEEFEKQGEAPFGEDGFFKIMDHVAEIEKDLDIYNLSKVTTRF